MQSAEIVNGYEYSKGRYVVITDDEMERIKTERDRAIRILHFAPPETIPSVYFDKSYLCVPDGSDKAYELLRRAMSIALNTTISTALKCNQGSSTPLFYGLQILFV